MFTIYWSDGEKTCAEADSACLIDLLSKQGLTFRVDSDSPNETEFSLLYSPFDFHPLTIEDVKYEGQRPKVKNDNDHLFLVAHEIACSPSSRSRGVHSAQQIAIFARQNSTATVHSQLSQAIHELIKQCHHRFSPLDRGVDFLLYSLLDHLVDCYFPVLDQLDKQIDHLEEHAVRKD